MSSSKSDGAVTSTTEPSAAPAAAPIAMRPYVSHMLGQSEFLVDARYSVRVANEKERGSFALGCAARRAPRAGRICAHLRAAQRVFASNSAASASRLSPLSPSFLLAAL